MSEKTKWFNPVREADIVIKPISEGVDVDQADAKRLIDAITGSGHGPPAILLQMCGMRPHTRLVRNLKLTLSLMEMGQARISSPPGLTAREHEALIEVERMNLPADIKDIAQGLLNVYERFQLLHILEPRLRKARKVDVTGQ